MIKQIYELIKKEKNIIRFIVILFIIGIVSGTLFINYISNHDKLILIGQVNSYFNSIKSLSKDVFGTSILISDIKSNLIQLFILYLLGISVIGVVIVIIIIYFKGFIFGITLSSFILKYKIKGIILSIIYTIFYIVPNLLCYLFISFFSVYVSIKVIKAFIRKDNLNFKSFLGKYLISFFISIILVILLSLIDSYLLPIIIKLIN